MTIKELALELGRSHQAVYKRIKKAGIPLEELQDKATGQLTEDGEQRLRDLYRQEPNRHSSSEESAPPPIQPVNPSSGEEVAELQTEVEKLRNQVAELQHRAELAEVKAAAALDERDFLRTQLDNAIKATALASVRRLTAPEEEQPAEVVEAVEEEAPAEVQQKPRKRLQERLQAAWQILRGKDQ